MGGHDEQVQPSSMARRKDGSISLRFALEAASPAVAAALAFGAIVLLLLTVRVAVELGAVSPSLNGPLHLCMGFACVVLGLCAVVGVAVGAWHWI